MYIFYSLEVLIFVIFVNFLKFLIFVIFGYSFNDNDMERYVLSLSQNCTKLLQYSAQHSTTRNSCPTTRFARPNLLDV